MVHICGLFDIAFNRPMNYLSIGGKSVIKNDQSKLTRWDVIIFDMEVPGKPFEDCCTKLICRICEFLNC